MIPTRSWAYNTTSRLSSREYRRHDPQPFTLKGRRKNYVNCELDEWTWTHVLIVRQTQQTLQGYFAPSSVPAIYLEINKVIFKNEKNEYNRERLEGYGTGRVK